jgi:outer membrane protein TolC
LRFGSTLLGLMLWSTVGAASFSQAAIVQPSQSIPFSTARPIRDNAAVFSPVFADPTLEFSSKVRTDVVNPAQHPGARRVYPQGSAIPIITPLSVLPLPLQMAALPEAQTKPKAEKADVETLSTPPQTPDSQISTNNIDEPPKKKSDALKSDAPSSPATVQNGTMQQELPSVSLLGEPSQDLTSLVDNVLSASVVKLREYPIDLQVVLKLIESQNLPIQRDRLTAKIQNTAFYRTISDALPDMNATYSQSRFQGAIQIFGSATLQVYQSRLVPQFQADWLIKPGGEDVFKALAARRRYKESKFRLDNTLQEQLSQAARAYYDFLEAKVQVDNVTVGLEEARGQVALNNGRLKAGVGTKLDLMRSQSQLAQKETDLVIAQNQVAHAEQALLNILNLDPDIFLTTNVEGAQPHILVPLTIKTDELVAHAIDKNPTLKAEAMALKAISADSKATLSRLVPTVSLQTYINGTGPEIDKLGLSRFGGFVVQSNLLDGLGTRIPLDYRTRRLEYHRQQIQVQQRLRDVQTQVLDAFLNSRAAAQSMITAQNALVTSQEAYRLSLGRYRAGLGINVDLLNAQTELSLSRTRITQAILSFNRAQVSLVEALGEANPDTLLNGVSLSPANRSAGKKSTP